MSLSNSQQIVMKYSEKFDILLTYRQSKIFLDPIGFSFIALTVMSKYMYIFRGKK